MTRDLAADRRLCESATPADRWKVIGNTFYIGHEFWPMLGQANDAAFIANAREALPYWLNLAEQQAAEIERLSRERNNFENAADHLSAMQREGAAALARVRALAERWTFPYDVAVRACARELLAALEDA